MHEINHCKCFVKKLYHVIIYLQMEQRVMAICQFSLWLQLMRNGTILNELILEPLKAY
jgi:hypothetical protein